jgi:hypothetical protein
MFKRKYFLWFGIFAYISSVLVSPPHSQTLSLSVCVVDVVAHQPVSQAIVMLLGTCPQKNINDIAQRETIKFPGLVLFGMGALGSVLHFVNSRNSFINIFHMNTELSSGITYHAVLEWSSNRYAIKIGGGHSKADNTIIPNGVLQFSTHDFGLICLLDNHRILNFSTDSIV